MYLDTSATGSTNPGDSKFQVVDAMFPGMLGTDTDHKTGLFDSMTFGIGSQENLTTISSQADIKLFTLDGVFLTSYGDSESIGKDNSDLSFYVEWDKSTNLLGEISFWFSDPNDNNGNDDTKVASGKITSLSETKLNANLDFLYSGFWLDQYSSEITASEIIPFKIAMSVQAGGNTVDIKAVPEPSIMALFSLGLAGFMFTTRRKAARPQVV